MASNATTQRCIQETRSKRGKSASQDGKLVLTLCEGDCIVIDDRFIVECISMRVGGSSAASRRVRIGTMAPGDVKVHRGEVWLKEAFAAAQEAKS